MKNKIAFVFWLCIAMLYFVSTHSLWAQFAPPPPAIIVPACGESGGYIDVEIGNYPAIDIQWENSSHVVISSGNIDIWDIPAGDYTVSISRKGFCYPAFHTYTIPQQTTTNQLKFVPGYGAVKVKVINGTALGYRLEVQLVQGGSIITNEWQTLSSSITGHGQETIEEVLGIEQQEKQQYFIVPIGSYSANYFRIWVKMLDGCVHFYTFSPVDNFQPLNISPNPAQNEIQVQPLVQNDQTAHLTIVDISGKMVLSQTISMNSPTTISVAHLPDGMYFYQTRHADFPIQTHKLNILR